jgi:alpha-ketoglutarate-dependent taurine dioxygenase
MAAPVEPSAVMTFPEPRPLGPRCGVVLESGGGRLADLDPERIQALFRAHGMLVFRGFAPTVAELEAFTRPFTAEHMTGYGRAPFPELKLVTLGNESGLPLEPHADNGLRPEAQRPEITWFMCEVPSDSAGETLFYDGIQLLARLTPATRELLGQKRVSYVSRVAEAAWRPKGFKDAESFARFVPQLGGRAGRILADGTVEVEVLSSALRRTRWNDQPAFVSSMCVPGSRGFEAMTASLEGEDAIPTSVRQEVAAALAACEQILEWRPRDVVMLDNTRFLHGRRGYADRRRTLYLVQTLRASF